MKQTFFFEIYSEEIPARMQKFVIPHAKEIIEPLISNIEHGDVSVFCAPHRLCVCVADVEEFTQSSLVQKRGPRVDAPAAAIDGFLRANGIARENLVEVNGYFFTNITSLAVAFADTIPEIVKSFICAVSWPKSMHWTISAHDDVTGVTQLRCSRSWVRPVRSLLCMLGEKCIPCRVDDWGIRAKNVTYVASTSGANVEKQPVAVNSLEHYLEILAANFVIVDYEARQRAVVSACQEALNGKGVELVPDKALLDEITGLVDYPFVVVGKIEDEFMHLPADVLQTSMRVHQKYFVTRRIGDQTGSIAPYFVAISNRPQNEITLRGFENVLRARLSDALFFYNEDLKAPLEDNLSKLDNIIFHEKLGSLGQKVKRLRRLVPDLDRSAMLCKLDLVSNMVNEFNELQGTMGAHYASVQGESQDVVRAIAGHYKGHGDSLPDGGAALAIADKLDTLVGFLSVGIKPTSSKDPYALRRAALGIIRISINCLQLDLDAMVLAAIAGYSEIISVNPDDVYQSVKTFIYERLAVYLKDQESFRYDVVQSVLDFAFSTDSSLNIKDIYVRVCAVQHYLESDGGDFMQLFTRINGLIRDVTATDVDDRLFEDPTEAQAYAELNSFPEDSFACTNERGYVEFMQNVSKLRPAFDHMLDAVQVNCENLAVRKNRQALLVRVLLLYRAISNFSKIEIC
ncbi:MAG: glycine--tRNA ligase subunit beta [Holosporales bacterium]|jgi:glycyl-tRNA synthetase beta chain|nr:glycine--tRNA ligase subunit beta [Holosporales bacterium]